MSFKEEDLEDIVEEEFKEEEEEDDLEYFNTLPTREKLEYHEYLLKNPRPFWIRAKVKTENMKSSGFSLLASCTETEKQSALAARVLTWKQRIEKNLDEQDARPTRLTFMNIGQGL
ncbi:hypothetical protein Tco_1241211 [Tanacetum coccineum]